MALAERRTSAYYQERQSVSEKKFSLYSITKKKKKEKKKEKKISARR